MTVKIDLIVKYPDATLFKTCERIEQFDKKLVALSNKMIFALKASNGFGLAAPQIGVAKQIFVYQDETTREFHTVVNPEIVSVSEEQTEDYEGCLSIPDHWFAIERSSEVTLKGQDLEGNPFETTATGMTARMFQHECDHLDGKLITYHLTNTEKASINATWQRKKKK